MALFPAHTELQKWALFALFVRIHDNRRALCTHTEYT